MRRTTPARAVNRGRMRVGLQKAGAARESVSMCRDAAQSLIAESAHPLHTIKTLAHHTRRRGAPTCAHDEYRFGNRAALQLGEVDGGSNCGEEERLQNPQPNDVEGTLDCKNMHRKHLQALVGRQRCTPTLSAPPPEVEGAHPKHARTVALTLAAKILQIFLGPASLCCMGRACVQPYPHPHCSKEFIPLSPTPTPQRCAHTPTPSGEYT
jgi:hypothetical protein